MSAYTKGPWEIREDGMVQQKSDKRLWICAPIDIPHKDGGEKATVANSTLIAAAPELLEALKMAVDSATPHVLQYYRPGVDCTEFVEETTWEPWVEVARAAIAKAEGK
jgi:hypothetical protein